MNAKVKFELQISKFEGNLKFQISNFKKEEEKRETTKRAKGEDSLW